MSDRIERLRLGELDYNDAIMADPECKPDDNQHCAKHNRSWQICEYSAIADAQLERVLDAEVTCPRCDQQGYREDEEQDFHVCSLCGDGRVVNWREWDERLKGTGTVTVRQLLERDGGEQ